MYIETDLSKQKWTLSGWTPHLWRLMLTAELGETPNAEIQGVSAVVPGSVQQALRNADLLPDWRVGENWRACEWVENRHWIYETRIDHQPPSNGCRVLLRCRGLDYAGWVYVNDRQVGEFTGTHIPHTFDLTEALKAGPNRLRIIFDLPPRWLGQFGYTSKVRQWKTRFNYTWDWQPRLVQTGIWDAVHLVETDGKVLAHVMCTTDADTVRGTGILKVQAETPRSAAQVRITLRYQQHVLRSETVPAVRLSGGGIQWRELPVDLWWPNGLGSRHLYIVDLALLDASGSVLHSLSRRVGFRSITWQQCEGAPKGADPWICVVNGRPIFLQGVNFPPTLPNYADTPESRYRKLLTTYADLGVNTLRVNGVGHLEREIFYNLCDELGILVWQDVPLSSSGVDNIPPDDPASIREVTAILRHYIRERGHHPSLLMWCGGNELHYKDPGGYGVPVTTRHPLIAAMGATAAKLDPTRRFIPSTATGPRFNADAKDFGKGLHWNTHGPWKLSGTMAEWRTYWEADDSLFRAESGAPGAAPVSEIMRWRGHLNPMPVSPKNPAWRRPLTWWIEDGAFQTEHGRLPETLDEYVEWSQKRQAEALVIAVGACRRRFPRCGGILLWCGHDAFPCPANTSILDYEGNPKPAALALKRIWREES
jgi:beta-mannosidase